MDGSGNKIRLATKAPAGSVYQPSQSGSDQAGALREMFTRIRYESGSIDWKQENPCPFGFTDLFSMNVDNSKFALQLGGCVSFELSVSSDGIEEPFLQN